MGQAVVALRLGQRAHGDQLDAALANMQTALAAHIAHYQPPPDTA